MRVRIWAVIAVAMLAVVAVGCAGGRSAQGPVGTPVPTKTLRPTFTHTPAVPTEVPPTATPVPTATPEVPTPTLTPEPTVEPPTPTPQPASFSVQSPTVNVRGGPGTSYSRIGQLTAGQTFEITGKNDTGDWWQFSYNGDPAWVAAEMVQATGTEAVEVAANIPALPTAVKRPVQAAPKPAPKPAAPTAPPAPATKFALRGTQPYVNTNNYVTVRCRVSRDLTDAGSFSGTMRVSGPGGTGEASFINKLARANTGMADEANQPIYNDGCKVEIRPSVEGAYTAVLIEGGQPVSDPATLTVAGDLREFVVRWEPR
jgi:Bacterial SH3 domain